MDKRYPQHRGRGQGGFTLIEVLVSLLILAIGLLGLAGMQASALRNNYSAYLRSQATFHVYEIMDRMRSNRNQALANGYDIGFKSSHSGGSCASTCSASEIANADLSEWLSVVSTRLPNGEGAVSVDAAGVATVRVRWSDRRDEVAADDRFVLQAKSQL